MNQNIKNLYDLSQKESRLILGLMSGTSLDGLDLALCKIKGSSSNTSLTILNFETLLYDEGFKKQIINIFAKEHGSIKMLSAMHAKVAITHANMINQTLNKWQVKPSEIDVIASHGQTIYHGPDAQIEGIKFPNSTLQIGDGDHIAVLTGIITISDFRQKHVAAGGQGAPLVVYGDYLLFSDDQENRVMLNIGGISNATFLPAKDTLKGTLSTDLGPGNTLMNQYVKHFFDIPFDKDGQLALKGRVNISLLKALKNHPFFARPLPKTTGPEEFNLNMLWAAKSESKTKNISHEDSLATLLALTVYGIATPIKEKFPSHTPVHLYLSGGGIYNKTLIRELQKEMPKYHLKSTLDLGVLPDAKEAALFALLANETLSGAPIPFPGNAGAPKVCMGKISFPN